MKNINRMERMEMSEECNHNCSTCGSECGERTNESLLLAPNRLSTIHKVIAVISGKGGVGKSMVTGLLANTARTNGKKTAILDADITGPSIPRMYGIKEKAKSDTNGVYPIKTRDGIEVMSINLLLENETDPVIWRGPIIAGTVTQFWTDVVWGNIDDMYVDMPPGTGDVPLTVFQSLPVNGIVVVTSPQELVSMIVEKAVHMAEAMNIPIVGIVENMSYFECPNCKERHEIYGLSNIDAIAKQYGIETVVKLPINPKMVAACDQGLADELNPELMQPIFDRIHQM